MSTPLSPEAPRLRPLLRVESLTTLYGNRVGCADVSLDLWPGEVLAVVGESGSGKTTLLKTISGLLKPSAGKVWLRDGRSTGDEDGNGEVDFFALEEQQRIRWMRERIGFVAQNPRDGLRMNVTAGANLAEPLLNTGARHYGQLRANGAAWMERVELDVLRIDDLPRTFSGGMQQRLQIARSLVNHPQLVCLDEPTGGLDVSVQARLLDLLRRLTAELHIAAIVVTHDLGVARLLSERMLVMRQGRVIEAGLTDQVLDDPQEPYTQLLASSVLST